MDFGTLGFSGGAGEIWDFPSNYCTAGGI